MAIRLHDLVPSLQIAIGPVILVSGVGLLLLSMTNRLGSRMMVRHGLPDWVRAAPGGRDRLLSQLEILKTRARLVRQAITLAIASLLSVAVLIITLFVARRLRAGSRLPRCRPVRLLHGRADWRADRVSPRHQPVAGCTARARNFLWQSRPASSSSSTRSTRSSRPVTSRSSARPTGRTASAGRFSGT